VKINFGQFSLLGDAALTISFGTDMSRATNARVVAATKAIRSANIPGISDVVPAFAALTVHFDPLVIEHAKIVEAIGRIDVSGDAGMSDARLIDIPVLYGGDAGPDLDEVTRETGLTATGVVDLHSSAEYHVYMLGFLPGFAYLGDLDEKLHLPRLKTPRTHVPAGSVAIADQTTAVYPLESPGGWLLIGRTPLRLFDHWANPPAVLAAGDRVRFRPVTATEFARIEAGA
jgi:KipI family sensor histidine kinase inhibitor